MFSRRGNSFLTSLTDTVLFYVTVRSLNCIGKFEIIREQLISFNFNEGIIATNLL